MNLSPLFFLMVLVPVSLGAQNVMIGGEEQDITSNNSPMMMWRSPQAEAVLALERYQRESQQRGDTSRQEEQRSPYSDVRGAEGESLPPINVESFRSIFEDDRFDENSIIGHTTGDEPGSYVEVGNSFSCFPNSIKRFCRSSMEQKQVTQASLKIKDDLRKALAFSSEAGESVTTDLNLNVEERFDDFCAHYPEGFTKGEFLDFCELHNIGTSKLSVAAVRERSSKSEGRYSLENAPSKRSEYFLRQQALITKNTSKGGYGSFGETAPLLNPDASPPSSESDTL